MNLHTQTELLGLLFTTVGREPQER